MCRLLFLLLLGCPEPEPEPVDGDRDGADASVDCDDANPSIHPAATERCNGIDDNCDQRVDEGLLTAWFVDADGDGYGDPATTAQGCAGTPGLSGNGTDCDDGDDGVHPGATETCDGVDTNCSGDEADAGDAATWYADDDADGWGDAGRAVTACEAPTGWAGRDGDCDDADGDVNPDAAEICNGADDDCDDEVDDGYDVAWFADGDGDGWGDDAALTVSCDPVDGHVGVDGDCDDADADVNPGAIEACNDVDDDCDGTIDPPLLEADFDGAFPAELALSGDAVHDDSGSDGFVRLTGVAADQEGGLATTIAVPSDPWRLELGYEVGGGQGGDTLAIALVDDTGVDRYVVELGIADRAIAVLDGSGAQLAKVSGIPDLHDAGEVVLAVWFDGAELKVALDGTTRLGATTTGYTPFDATLRVTARTADGRDDQHVVDDLRLTCD